MVTRLREVWELERMVCGSNRDNCRDPRGAECSASTVTSSIVVMIYCIFLRCACGEKRDRIFL